MKCAAVPFHALGRLTLALIPRQDASSFAGKAITFQTSTASDTLVGGQCVHLVVNNTSGASRTVTLVTPETVEGTLPVGDRTITVPVGIYEIPVPSRYNDPTGVATVTVDTPGATCTYAAVQGSATP
jgi:hypothetical protein